jgi:dihydrofolate reductase
MSSRRVVTDKRSARPQPAGQDRPDPEAETLPPSERELLEAASRGDAIAFGHLVSPYRGELRAADTLLLGRTSYDGFKSFWPSVADNTDRMSALSPDRRDIVLEISRLNNAIDKVVISDTLTPEQTHPWQNTELKRQAGNDILIFGSNALWNDLLANDLVDELHLMIGAVILGAGIPPIDDRTPPALW